MTKFTTPRVANMFRLHCTQKLLRRGLVMSSLPDEPPSTSLGVVCKYPLLPITPNHPVRKREDPAASRRDGQGRRKLEVKAARLLGLFVVGSF